MGNSSIRLQALCIIDLGDPDLTFCMDITFVSGNDFWKLHADTIRGTLLKGDTERKTDGWTDRQDRS